MGHNLRTIGKVIVPERYAPRPSNSNPPSANEHQYQSPPQFVTDKDGLRWMSEFTNDKLNMNKAHHLKEINKVKKKLITINSDDEY